MLRTTPIALLLAVLALAGCGGSDDETTAPTTTAATQPAEDAIRVGLITDKGQLDDDGFNELAFRGLTRAEEELGIEGRVIESASAADYIPNMTSLARQGYDLVIGVGFAQGDVHSYPLTTLCNTNLAVDSCPGLLDFAPAHIFQT
jgi:basic membrane protein A